MIRCLTLLLALAACTPAARPGAPTGIEADSIRYATGPCFGTCPVYSVTVTPDGAGTFVGERFTAVSGTRGFRIPPARYAALAATLAPYRPAGGERRIAQGTPDCGNAPTDMPSTDVTWTRAAGDSARLSFYHGCAANNRALADTLREVPAMLPIGNLVGKR